MSDQRIDALIASDREMMRCKINTETARIPWRDLQRFFAAGKVIRVATGLDLVEVAHALQRDDVDRVESWAAGRELAPVSDDEARGWFDAGQTLWAVVVKPWVLVQEIGAEGD